MFCFKKHKLEKCELFTACGDFSWTMSASEVVVSGEVGILLIYAHNFFMAACPAKDKHPF